MELDVNLTPTSSEGPAPVSGVAGVAVFGQIVHGQEGGGSVGVTVRLSGACAVCIGLLESLTWTVKLVVPVPVGVPEITPVVESISPAGKLEPDTNVQLYGAVPPPAVNVWL